MNNALVKILQNKNMSYIGDTCLEIYCNIAQPYKWHCARCCVIAVKLIPQSNKTRLIAWFADRRSIINHHHINLSRYVTLTAFIICCCR